MKLETVFEKFDLFADAPNAVAKMRELVRELAVGGRLFDKVADVEANDWPQRQLGEVAQFINGDRSKNYPSKSFRVADGVPFINAGHLSNGDIDLTNMDYITPEHFDRLGGGKVEPGDVLYCLRGSLGKCAVVANIKRGAIASSLLIIRPYPQTFSRFIHLVLTSPLGSRLIAKYDNGSAQPNLSATNVKKYVVPLPPLAEQKRIVAKVDELMALCDRLEAQQQERETRHAALARASLARFADAPTPANLSFLFHPSYTIEPADLRKAILTLAVQGKLVPQDPEEEPAEVLLAKLSKRSVEETGRSKKSQPNLAFTSDEIPFELPLGWAWERLGNIGETNIGLTYSPQDVSDVGIPVLRSSNIQNGKLDFDDLVRVTCEPKQSVMVQDGDLLICARNGSRALVGKVAVIEELKEPAAFGAFMAIYRSEVNQYLYHFIRSPIFREMLDEVNTTTINQITQNNLRSTLAPIPPLAEQRRIVAKVEQLMALVDELETQLAASRATGANLLSALVAELTTAS